MCPGCGRCWTALQVVWSTVYVICGAAQLISGIFFMISIPALQLTCNIWAGTWNVVIGIVGGMLACLGVVSPRRQEFLLYMGVSILTVNCVNVVLSEWGLYFSDTSELLKKHPNHMLIDYACFATRIATAAVILVAFLDSQFAFCSMHSVAPKRTQKKPHGSHEQVSDIEYIIPRPKSAKPQTSVYNAYSQSWVFESDTASCSNPTPEGPYLKILENGTPKTQPKSLENGIVSDTTHLIDNPVVHIEEASDDSNSDRKLCHMRSFSRSASPVHVSSSSSHINLPGAPPIYDCLENIYRSRLNTGPRDDEADPQQQYQQPQAMVMRSVSPHVEKVQYASLMKELQRAIVSKKEASATSPSDTQSSSRQDSSCKSSDAEFSKELEAALQLIQDLESPNTVETPSEPAESRPLAVWHGSDNDSDKTLSPSPPPMGTFKPPPNGKGSRVIIRHCPDSQSTSGYSSPSHPTPSWSTTSSLNGSSSDMAYSIHNANSATVISLYSQVNPSPKGKSVTLVNICGTTPDAPTQVAAAPKDKANGWNVKSLLRKKKQTSLPKLCPELEGAIIKSESLAYLSELELLARHQRNKEIHREIEERVIQQLGTPRTESNC